jgi:DNA-binding IclR family transcriptional regulator
MSRKSPAVDRIVSILNFVVAHPEQSFTLTQIITALKLSRATCHALLMGLVDAGFLYRAPDKSYVVGPALISLALNAQRHVSPLAVARQEMRMLADEFDVIAAAIFREGEELVVRDRAASLSHLGQAVSSGLRLPLLPNRNFFLLALSEDELEAELRNVKPRLSVEERSNTHRVVAFAREHGFMLGADTDSPDAASVGLSEGRRAVTEVQLKAEYRLQFMVAPVYDGRGKVAFGITLWGTVAPMTGSQVLTMGKRLVEACGRVSTTFAGMGASSNLQANGAPALLASAR